MPINWTSIGLELAGQSVPLIQQFIQASIEGKAEERKMKIMNKKIHQMSRAIETSDSSPGTSTPKLSVGIRRNESVESLGRRKWKEYETVLDSLPDNAPASEVKQTLNKIQDNIVNHYPCENCRVNAINNLKKAPLISRDVKTKQDAQRNLCNFHNAVREMLGKPITHNCDVIFG